jgi:hypothetical protein
MFYKLLFLVVDEMYKRMKDVADKAKVLERKWFKAKTVEVFSKAGKVKLFS